MSVLNRISDANQGASFGTVEDGSFSQDSANADSQAVERFAQLMKNGSERQDNSESSPERDDAMAQQTSEADKGRKTLYSTDDEKSKSYNAFSQGSSLAQAIPQSTFSIKTKCSGGSDELYSVCQQVLERVLTAVPTVSGDRQEVRLTMKDSILPSTEICISRDGVGLHIAIVTESQKSYNLLDQQKEVLQNRLNERLVDFRIEVNITYNERGGDQQGRSRQRRNLYEEMDDHEITAS